MSNRIEFTQKIHWTPFDREYGEVQVVIQPTSWVDGGDLQITLTVGQIEGLPPGTDCQVASVLIDVLELESLAELLLVAASHARKMRSGSDSDAE